MGIVRRRKVDVAKDIPARRIADIPVELDDEVGRSIREAERELARRLVQALRERRSHPAYRSTVDVDGIDHELVRRVATWEREDTTDESTGENVFAMMRRIGQAKAGLAADYTAQLARNVGKVVFFAKHIDVMDTAEATFAKRGMRYSSIRGDQTRRPRESAASTRSSDDPDVAVDRLLADAPPASASTCRSPPTSCWPSCRGPTPSRRRRSTACTASARTSRSPRGGSSPRRPSTPGSPS